MWLLTDYVAISYAGLRQHHKGRLPMGTGEFQYNNGKGEGNTADI